MTTSHNAPAASLYRRQQDGTWIYYDTDTESFDNWGTGDLDYTLAQWLDNIEATEGEWMLKVEDESGVLAESDVLTLTEVSPQ